MGCLGRSIFGQPLLIFPKLLRQIYYLLLYSLEQHPIYLSLDNHEIFHYTFYIVKNILII